MLVSVIIPTRNRRDLLRQTLASLRLADHRPGDCEVLVIDNGSTDGSKEVVEDAARDWKTLRYCHEPMPGLLSGRHRGAVEAAGEICAYLDDDVRVTRDWLTCVKDAFRDRDAVLVGGPSTPAFEAAPPEWLAGFYVEDAGGRYCGWLSLIDLGPDIKPVDPHMVWGLNYAIRRQTLQEIGGFHPDNVPKPLQRYQGDGESGSSRRVKEAGLKAVYHPGAAVEHLTPASRLTLDYFEQRAFYQGVCDSYTRIRAERTVTETSESRPLVSWFREALRPARARGGNQMSLVRQRTDTAYQAGYGFHRDEVRRDPSLLAWVLRDNYWDYALPPGWERYMNAEPQAR